MLTQPRRVASSNRRRGDQPPAWARDLADDVADVRARLSRIEGGLALAATLAGLLVVLLAGHVVSVHL